MKSKKVTKEMLDEAKQGLDKVAADYSMAASNLRFHRDLYHTLVKHASASVVKEHTLKKN